MKKLSFPENQIVYLHAKYFTKDNKREGSMSRLVSVKFTHERFNGKNMCADELAHKQARGESIEETAVKQFLKEKGQSGNLKCIIVHRGTYYYEFTPDSLNSLV